MGRDSLLVSTMDSSITSCKSRTHREPWNARNTTGLTCRLVPNSMSLNSQGSSSVPGASRGVAHSATSHISRWNIADHPVLKPIRMDKGQTLVSRTLRVEGLRGKTRGCVAVHQMLGNACRNTPSEAYSGHRCLPAQDSRHVFTGSR
jgi:hypothetical protein